MIDSETLNRWMSGVEYAQRLLASGDADDEDLDDAHSTLLVVAGELFQAYLDAARREAGAS